MTYNAPYDKCWLDNVLKAEYCHSQVGKHASLYAQHKYIITLLFHAFTLQLTIECICLYCAQFYYLL